RRPRAGLVSRHSGGRGHPSAGTMTGCLEWLDAVGLKGGGSRLDKRRLRVGPHPEARAREQKSPWWSAGRRGVRVMDAAALEAALEVDAPFGAPPPRPCQRAEGRQAKSGAVWRAVTITHAFSTNSNLGAPFMSQQPSIEPATESLPHRRRSRRLSRAERESARDRANVA